MNTKNSNPNRLHVYLANLIKGTFGVFLEVEHVRLESGPFRAVTMVSAYRTLEDARNGFGLIASARAECSRKDQFVRAKGLEIALRRLYRALAAKKRLGEI